MCCLQILMRISARAHLSGLMEAGPGARTDAGGKMRQRIYIICRPGAREKMVF